MRLPNALFLALLFAATFALESEESEAERSRKYLFGENFLIKNVFNLFQIVINKRFIIVAFRVIREGSLIHCYYTCLLD